MLKVYGLNLFIPEQRRCIVAATSQKEAARLMKTSLSYLRGYGAVTANKREVEVAIANPRKVFTALDKHKTNGEYVEVIRA